MGQIALMTLTVFTQVIQRVPKMCTNIHLFLPPSVYLYISHICVPRVYQHFYLLMLRVQSKTKLYNIVVAATFQTVELELMLQSWEINFTLVHFRTLPERQPFWDSLHGVLLFSRETRGSTC